MALSPKIIYAQEKYFGEGSIDIWNSDLVWAGQGYFAYKFTIDALGLPSNIESVTNCIIKTNYGDIEFQETFDSSSAGRYSYGTLYSQEDIEQIQITQAIGVVNGKMLDITSILSVREFTPARIVIRR
jgi:hypothetical protein